MRNRYIICRVYAGTLHYLGDIEARDSVSSTNDATLPGPDSIPAGGWECDMLIRSDDADPRSWMHVNGHWYNSSESKTGFEPAEETIV